MLKSVTISIILLVFMIMSFYCSKNQSKEIIKEDNMDFKVVPGDDFDAYANNGWKKNNPIPSDKSRYGTFDKLEDESKKQLKSLVTRMVSNPSNEDPLAQKIALYYNSGMNIERIKKVGLEPLSEEFSKICAIQTDKDIFQVIADFQKKGINALFDIFASMDGKNSGIYIAHIGQGGLGLSDRDYYLKDDQRSKQILKDYRLYIENILNLINDQEKKNGEEAEKIIKFETRLAEKTMSRLELRDPYKTYNKMPIKKLQDLNKRIQWKRYLKNAGLQDLKEINIRQPEFFKEINKMLYDIPMDEWKLYLKWKLINFSAPYLDTAFAEENFNFYGKAISGKKRDEPRWKKVLNNINNAMGMAIGKFYVERFFPEESKQRMITLVNNLKRSFSQRIKRLKWMGEETKQKALDKLNSMNVKIGFPDKWQDFSKLKIKDDSYIENVFRGNIFNYEYNINKVNTKVDKDEWFIHPQTVNAYYSSNMNEICFPAAILQPPFFYAKGDEAVNYGAIGVVIGHEMTHGFDDQGRLYDKDGNLKNWWTDEDADRFKSKTKVLKEQYDSYVVLVNQDGDKVHANGKLSLGENIADLGGVVVSLDALKGILKGSRDEEKNRIEGYTQIQRFFLSYAHIWAQNITRKEILRRTKEDVHSLGKFRINGPVVNVDEFYKAFAVTKDHKMFIEKKKRAKIW